MSNKQEDKYRYITRKSLLIRACDQEDQQAWEEFISYYKPFIFIILRHLCVKEQNIDDLGQSVILDLWKTLKKFDPARAKFRTWLSQIIRHKVSTFKTKEYKDKTRDGKYFTENYRLTDSELEKIFDAKWRAYLTNVALENLKKNFSGKAINVFLLSLKNTPIEDIGLQLDLKINSVHRLRKRVQEQLTVEICRLRGELEN